MPYPPPAGARTELEQLNRQLTSLSNEVDQVSSGHDTLKGEVDELSQTQVDHSDDIESLKADIEDIKEGAESLEERLGDDIEKAFSAVKRLEARAAVLEHHVRALDGAEPVDLDDVGPETESLVHAVLAGRDASDRLLTQRDRRSLETTVESYERAQQHLADARDKALAHSRTLAERYTAEAVTGFESSQQAAEAHASRVENDRRDYAEACEDLAADDEAQAEAQPLIREGLRAQAQLRTVARERIAAALDDRALLPTWFTAPLGYGPPPEPGPWAELATDLIAYRVTYGVRDRVVALGDRPRKDGQRRRDYDDLAEKLRKVR